MAPKAFPYAGPSDPDTMSNTAIEAIASSSGKNQYKSNAVVLHNEQIAN